MHIQALRREGGKAIGELKELLAYVAQVFEPLLQFEVGQVVRANLVTQEHREFLVLFPERELPVGTKDVMTVLDLFQRGGKLALEPLTDAGAEDLRYLVGGETPQPQLAAALEDFVNRKVALEDEVAAVLDLADGVETAQVDLLAFL